MEQINKILKDHWGFDDFRPMQADIINALLEGMDTLAVLPTGGGKSICFQLPALKMDGICIVVSPLIALMKDQVENLKKKGIPALSLYSGLNYIEVNKILQNATFGNYKFLYVSPERLESDLFLEYLPGMPVSLIAVDEAHCVSQWGYDFRPPYLRIASIRTFFPSVPVIALTASATKEVRVDIVEKLAFNPKEHKVFRQSFSRPALSYSVFNPPSKENKLIEILKKVGGSGIVYCKSRKKTREIADLLNMNGISTEHYHAGLSGEQRNQTQQNWISNKVNVISCTNAFGMGIDKPDVRAVVHFDVPESLENYYQEAGRAGRDGKRAYAVLLFKEKEISELNAQVDIRFPDKKTVSIIYQALVNYLQLPSDSGENLYFDFDLKDFCEKFKFNQYTAIYSLKVLQQEDIIAYAEEVFIPSKVVFTTSKENLDLFELSYPDFEPVIKALLRSYNGIFDYPSAIVYKNLCRSLKIEEHVLKSQLILLQKMGIIAYEPQSSKPQIQFLKNRVKTEDLYLNEKNIQLRKNAFTIRINGITNYINDRIRCRSSIIGGYFDDNQLPACCICDNCINKNSISGPSDLVTLINNFLKEEKNEVKVETILEKFPYPKEEVWKVLDFFIGEKVIKIDSESRIIAKKKGPR